MRKSTLAILIIALLLLTEVQETFARSRDREDRERRRRRRDRDDDYSDDDYDDDDDSDYDDRRSSRRSRSRRSRRDRDDDYSDDRDDDYSDDVKEKRSKKEAKEEEPTKVEKKETPAAVQVVQVGETPKAAETKTVAAVTAVETAASSSIPTTAVPVAAPVETKAAKKEEPVDDDSDDDDDSEDERRERRRRPTRTSRPAPKAAPQEIRSEDFSTLYNPETATTLIKTNTFGNAYKPADGAQIQNGASGIIKTKFNQLESPVMDIMWCGEKKDTVFLLTEKGILYRSTDDVFSGQIVTEHLKKIGAEELEDQGKSFVGEVSRMVQSPVEPSIILIMGTKHINWVTEDCGATFKAMDQGRPVDEFQFHPTERSWLLASAWTLCSDFEGANSCKRYKELYVTKDLGQNWAFVAHYVFDYSWGIVDETFFRVPKERILITHDPHGKGNQTEGNWKTNLVVSFSDDFFNQSTITVAKGGNRFLLTTNYLFVVKANDDKAQDVTLLVGSPREKDYILNEIELPNARILDHGYTVLDTSEDSVFLHVDHSQMTAPFGNIYVSDFTGTRFSLALKHNVRNSEGQADFERLEGLDGVYLANVFDEEVVKKYQRAKEEEEAAFPTQKEGSKKTSKSAYKDKKWYNADTNAGAHATEGVPNLKNFKKTMISFDKGGIWTHLAAPQVDFTGKRIICAIEEECYLHLHSISSTRFGPFYSTEQSHGLIMGTGNVGSHLSNKPDEINTYLSRDAGLTWYEVAKGSHIYEVGDHGGIIVMAPNQKATKEIFYSWNEGLTFEVLPISNTPVEVTNIIIEPDNINEKFVIYGREANKFNGIVVAADFSTLHQRVCQMSDAAGSATSDYELWTPNGPSSPKCLLGRTVNYIRRKRDAQCFNNEEFENWSYVKSCTCTEEDWECDVGFSREGNGPCMPDSEDVKRKTFEVPSTCSSYYFISQGYRKVPGDSCEGGINHEAIRMPCPGSGIFSMKNLSNFFMLACLIMVIMWVKNSQSQMRVKSIFEMVKGKFASKDPRKKGYSNDLPEISKEGDGNEFSNGIFADMDDPEERNHEIHVAEDEEDDDNVHATQARRMTEGKAIDGAKKRVPLLQKPGESRDMDDIRGFKFN